jgi:hypothetical protein
MAVADNYGGGGSVSWIHKIKFMEVGQQIPGTYAIKWTRFDFGDALVRDRKLVQTSHTTGTYLSCYTTYEAVYEGQYTRLDSTVATILVEMFFKYSNGGCISADKMGLEIWGSSAIGDEFYWRFVTVNNLYLGGGGCTNSYYADLNGAAGWTQVQEGSIVDSPSGVSGSDVAKIENGVGNPTKRVYIRVDPHYHNTNPTTWHGSDLIASFNIGTDTNWFFDRPLGELAHDASESEASSLTDTSCVNLVFMVEHQTRVFYAEPTDFDYTHAWYDLENM